MSGHRAARRRAPLWVMTLRVLTVVAFIGAIVTAPHSSGLGPPSAHADTASTSPAFSTTKTLTRDKLVADGGQLSGGATCNQAAGCTEGVESKNLSLSVDVTSGLQTYQQVNVTWSGAHPTNFINSDPNTNVAGAVEEYPMVLMQCRGVDDTSQPVDKQINPQTCWTEYDAERFLFSATTAYPSWRLDRNASSAARAQYVNKPNPLPSNCFDDNFGMAAATMPLVAAGGTVYDDYNCSPSGTRAPEQLTAAGTNSNGVPDNTTFAVTNPDGTGRSKFVIWTDETNATLGCSSTVPCTLVAIPIMGISCDETMTGASLADIASCEYTDNASGVGGDSGANRAKSWSVEGDAWWTASNWNNRVSVPLKFAPPASYCSTVSSKAPVLVYGSELMTEAAAQWAPIFCTDPNRSPFAHIPEAEPAAVNTLTQGTTEAAFDSYSPVASSGGDSTGPPVVNAPVAVTGFAVASLIDDAAGREVTDIKLDPRLIAKLITESYPVLDDIANGDGGTFGTDQATGKRVLTSPGPMTNNPLDITMDPEFVALNPTIPADSGGFPNKAALALISSSSDVVHALTSYLNADPAARAFLNGTPDPWGMVVNPAYKNITLPTNFWDLKDTFIDTSLAIANPCWGAPEVHVPYLPLVAAPPLYLRNVAQDVEFGLPNSTTNCTQLVNGSSQLSALARMQPGQRFMLGLVSLSQAHLYALDTTRLETQTTVAPDQKFTSTDAADPTKFTFVAASDASMQTAADQLAPDPTAGNFGLDYAKLRSSFPTAYPGTMLVSMTVPTLGLSTDDASAYSKLLKFAATDGQTPGTDFGQLPAGYLPMTTANGLGALVTYTQRAATAIGDQTCEIPNVSDAATVTASASACPSPSPSPSPSPTSSVSQLPPPQAAPAVPAGPPAPRPPGPQGATQQAVASTSAAAVASSVLTTAAAVAATSEVASPLVQQTGYTRGASVGAVGNLVPGLLLLAGVIGTLALIVHAVADARISRTALAGR